MWVQTEFCDVKFDSMSSNFPVTETSNLKNDISLIFKILEFVIKKPNIELTFMTTQ
jgi:hypothetical protein